MKKRIVALLLAAMLAMSASFAAAAVEPGELFEITSKDISVKTKTVVQVNPLYKDVITEDDLRPISKQTDSTISQLHGEEQIFTSFDEVALAVRGQMKDRVEVFKIAMALDKGAEAPLQEIIDSAVAHTGVGTEGDYLAWQYGGWEAEIATTSGPAMDYDLAEVTFCVTYYTTLEQENELTEAINDGLDDLNFAGAETDYEIVKVVYDWVTSHVTYDDEHLSDSDYTLKFSAYAAIMNGTSVCQGYANAMYRLLLDLTDLDCRLIAGVATGGETPENHSWNIVKVEDSYYYIDATWDAGVEEYSYFLKGRENFTDHVPFQDKAGHHYGYYSPEFAAAHPISETDYEFHDEPEEHSAVVVIEKKQPTCTEDGCTEGTVCANHPDDKEDPCYKESEVRPKLGHTIVIDKSVAPTYTATGLTEGSHCLVCKTVIKGQVVIPKLIPPTSGFADVENGRYYTAAVNWAVACKVTTGTSPTTFSPDDYCTRGQVVTFLWRAKGSPEPKSSGNPFTDVQDRDKFYYKAVLWAVENGITNGTSPTTFSPEKTVTRGQFVSFLYRAQGKPSVSGKGPFTDVDTAKYYAVPVLWAYNTGVTTGTSGTTFSPEDPCKRAQVVAFLYRALN